MSIGTGRALRMAYLVAGLAGIGFFVMSVVLLGYWPGRVLEDQTRRMSPGMPLGLSVSEQRGRDVYAREGCAYCHTQQIRYLDADIARLVDDERQVVKDRVGHMYPGPKVFIEDEPVSAQLADTARHAGGLRRYHAAQRCVTHFFDVAFEGL